MKSKLYIILFILSSIGCETRSKFEIKFESNLPKADHALLEDIVRSYDNFIETNYAGNAYHFFAQLESKEPIFDESKKLTYCELLLQFDKSTLEYKRQNVKYDSVYLSEDGGIVREKQEEDTCIDELEYDEEIDILSRGQTIEDRVNYVKNNGYWKFVSESSFRLALSKVSESKTEIKDYIHVKDVVGYINPQLMAAAIRKDEVDTDDYFVKRIVAIELFIKQIRIELGC